MASMALLRSLLWVPNVCYGFVFQVVLSIAALRLANPARGLAGAGTAGTATVVIDASQPMSPNSPLEAENVAGWLRTSSNQTFFGKAGSFVADDHVIEYSNINQRQRFFQSFRNADVGLAGFADARWMIVGEYDSGRIVR